MIDDAILKKWEKEYIEDLNIKDRTYILLNAEDMKKFIDENYYDAEIQRYVTANSDAMLMGLQYIDYACKLISGDNARFLICIIDNNKGTKTILSQIIYHENCVKVVQKQLIPVTFLEYLEVNKYFRNLGLSKEILSVFAEIAPEDRMLLTTSESLLGHKYHLFETLKETLNENEFKEDVRTLTQMDEDYINVLKGKEFTLKKTYQ